MHIQTMTMSGGDGYAYPFVPESHGKAIQERIRERIAKLLYEKRITKAAFAVALGNTPGWAYSYFAGQHGLRTEYLEPASAALGISVYDLTKPTTGDDDSDGTEIAGAPPAHYDDVVAREVELMETRRTFEQGRPSAELGEVWTVRDRMHAMIDALAPELWTRELADEIESCLQSYKQRRTPRPPKK
jgi:transcriptional regulator with XRE-family HTH domain